MSLFVGKFKAMFFNESVRREVGGKIYPGLLLAGAYTRRTARSSIKAARRMKLSELSQRQQERYRSDRRRLGYGAARKLLPLKSSDPGKPPRSITGLLKNFIYFGYDRQSMSMIVGPAKLGTGQPAPKTLEEGGTARISFRRKNGSRFSKQIKIKPRPYMKPALAATIGKIKDFIGKR